VCASLRVTMALVPALRAHSSLLAALAPSALATVQRSPHLLQALAPASRARIPAAALCAAASLAARDRCSDCSAQTAHSSVCRGACAYSSWSHTRHRRAAGAAVLRLLFFSPAACLSLVAVKTSTRSASGAAALGLERGMAFHARGRMRAASFAARGRAFGLRVALTVAQLAVRVAMHAHVRYCSHIRAAASGPEAPPGRPGASAAPPWRTEGSEVHRRPPRASVRARWAHGTRAARWGHGGVGMVEMAEMVAGRFRRTCNEARYMVVAR